MICDYGCGKEAIFTFRNGKYCCSIDYKSCSAVIERRMKKVRGIPKSSDHRKKLRLSKLGKRRSLFSKEWRENLSKKAKGRGKNIPKSMEHRAKLSLSLLGKSYMSEKEKEKRRAIMLNGGAKYLNSIPRDLEKVKMASKKHSGWMKENGNRIRRHIKNPSINELRLRAIVKDIFPSSKHTYPILTYDVDVALIDYKIAIEYDGYYHFCDKEHIEYHNKRQKEIEDLGWKFLRYVMFDKFPSEEQVKKDIMEIINVT